MRAAKFSLLPNRWHQCVLSLQDILTGSKAPVSKRSYVCERALVFTKYRFAKLMHLLSITQAHPHTQAGMYACMHAHGHTQAHKHAHTCKTES
uniref:Uncharacterized protein n=1 Tax=Ixodes ricinus TaxID=34613 RepID=A0A6B0UC26_IXORI